MLQFRQMRIPVLLMVVALGSVLMMLMAQTAPVPPVPGGAPTGNAATTPAEASDRRVLIISVDGLRPDLALRANMPAVRSLIARGSFTFWAKTTAMAVTLPSHTSMLTGVHPGKHGILWRSEEHTS